MPISKHYGKLLPGLLLSALLGLVALAASKIGWLEAHSIGALTLAMILGTLAGNTVYGRIAARCGSGVNFSRLWALRAGIVLYGLHLSLHDIAQVGVAGVLIDGLVLCTTFGLAWVLGIRLLKMERNTVLLIGAGSSICGAAAIMATEDVVRGRAEQVTVAVSTVLLFGTLATFLYPLLFQFNQHAGWLPASQKAFGIYTGSTVHEVAQVVAAAHSVSHQAADTAVITKMVRVMMLAPFLILLSACLSRKSGQEANTPSKKSRIIMPWFAILFFIIMLFHTFVALPEKVVHALLGLDTLLLATAMAALGLATHVSAIRNAGYRPHMLAGVLFLWLVIGGAFFNHVVMDRLG